MLRFLSPDIVAITPTGAPALHLILALCPSHLPGGGGTHIPPRVLAPGVAPGHVLCPLREDHHRTEGCTGMFIRSQAYFAYYLSCSYTEVIY